MAETSIFSTSPPMTEHFGSQQLQPEGLGEEEEHCSSACPVSSSSSSSSAAHHRGSSLHSSSSSTASFSMEWEGSAASAFSSTLHVPHPGPTVLPRRLSPQPLQDRALSPLSQMTEHLSKYTLSSPCTSPAPSNNPASSSSASTHRFSLSLSGLSSSSSSSSMVASPSSSSSSLSGGLPRCFIENSVLASPQPLSPRQHPMFLEDDDDYDDDEEDNDEEQDEDASDLDGSDAENEGGRLRLSALSSIPEIMVKSPPNKTITNSHVGKNQKREPLAERKDHSIPPIPIAAVLHKGEAPSTTDDVHKRWALNSNNRQSMEATTDNHLFPIAQKSKSEGDLPSSSEDEKENVCNASATTAYSVLGALSSPQLPGDLKEKRNKSARLRSKQLQNLVEGSAARRNTCLSATNSPALSQRGGRSTCAQELQARVQAKKQELMANNPLRRRSCSVSAAESGGMHGSGFEFAEPSDFAASFSSSSNASTNCLFTQSSNDVPVRTRGTDSQLARLRAERLQVQAKISGRQSPTSSASSSCGRIGTSTLPLIPEGSALTSNLNLSPRYSLRRSNSQDLLHISPRRRKGRKKDSSLKKCFLMDPIPAAPSSSSPSLPSSSFSSSASSTSFTDTNQNNNAASNIFRQLSNSCSNVPLQRRPRSASPALSANTNATSELGEEASSSVASAAVPVPSPSLRRGHSMSNIYEGIHAQYNRDFSDFLLDGNDSDTSASSSSEGRSGRTMSEKCASSACSLDLNDSPFASSPPESFFMSGTVSVRQKKEQMKPRVRGMGLRRTVSEMNIQSRYVQCTTGTHAAPRKRKQRNPLTLSLSSLPEEDLRTNNFNGELPIIQHSQYNSIEPATLHRLLDGDLKHLFREVYVVDCRYPYEYEGGHIKGAVNLHTPEQIESMFMGGCTKQGKFIAIVFHCEFSSIRGPQGYRHLRSLDREANINRYPHLFYPNMFLLAGGYKKFFEYNKEYCDPPEYVRMEDDRFISMKVQHIKENKRSFKKQRSLSFCFTRPSTFGWNPLVQLQNQESSLSLSSPGLLIYTDTSSSSTPSSSSSSSSTTGPNETDRSDKEAQ
ncbi:M-phase inducer phosphatase 1 [Balamuthia mandrillaris]